MSKRRRLVSMSRKVSSSEEEDLSDVGENDPGTAVVTAHAPAAPTAKPAEPVAAPRYDCARLTPHEITQYYTSNLQRNGYTAEFRISGHPLGRNATRILEVLEPVNFVLRCLTLNARSTEEGDPNEYSVPSELGCLLIMNSLFNFVALSFLDLSHAPLTDDGLRALGLNIGKCTRLETLVLEDCALGKNQNICIIGMRALARGLNECKRLAILVFSNNELTLEPFAEFVGNLAPFNIMQDIQSRTIHILHISIAGNSALLDALVAIQVDPLEEDSANPKIYRIRPHANKAVALLQSCAAAVRFTPPGTPGPPVLEQLMSRNMAALCWAKQLQLDRNLSMGALRISAARRPLLKDAREMQDEACRDAQKNAAVLVHERAASCLVCLKSLVDPSTQKAEPQRRFGSCCHGCCADCAKDFDSQTLPLLGKPPLISCGACGRDTRAEPCWMKGHTVAPSEKTVSGVQCTVCGDAVIGLCAPQPIENAAAYTSEEPPTLKGADEVLEKELLVAYAAIEESCEAIKMVRQTAEGDVRGAMAALRALLYRQEQDLLNGARESFDRKEEELANTRASIASDLAALYQLHAMRVAACGARDTDGAKVSHMGFWMDRERLRIETRGSLSKLPEMLPSYPTFELHSDIEEAIETTYVNISSHQGTLPGRLLAYEEQKARAAQQVPAPDE